MSFAERLGVHRKEYSQEAGSVLLEARLETRDDEEQRCPENTLPREIWLKGIVVEEILPVESLFLVSHICMYHK